MITCGWLEMKSAIDVAASGSLEEIGSHHNNLHNFITPTLKHAGAQY
jgi:hypothetical protein